jgi:polyisoprenoid-binding protein YceI
MKILKRFILAALAIVLVACVSPEQSSKWSLDAEQSSLRFITVKNSTVAETHHFDRMSGVIEANRAMVTVALDSVNTGIQIRDERMQGMLFEVASFAKLSATVDLPEGYADLARGEQQRREITLQLNLHGVGKELSAEVLVSRAQDGALLVATLSPLVVKAQDFGLENGVDKLREVAGLQHISYAVPVSFNLRFTR